MRKDKPLERKTIRGRLEYNSSEKEVNNDNLGNRLAFSHLTVNHSESQKLLLKQYNDQQTKTVIFPIMNLDTGNILVLSRGRYS